MCALSEDHAHGERGEEDQEIDYLMDRRGCNDAGSKLNESNQGPSATRVEWW